MEISRVAKWNHLHSQTLEKQYKEHLSNFLKWEQNVDEKALVYPENFGERMSMDETALHNGELYTVITNKDGHGRKGSLAALIKGTKNSVISKALEKIGDSKIPSLISASNTIQNNLGKILNYFPDRSTNASAESFNAKLKGFRSLVRGVTDIKFFLFRISTSYA